MKIVVAVLVSLFAVGSLAGCGNNCESKCKELGEKMGKTLEGDQLKECVSMCEKAMK